MLQLLIFISAFFHPFFVSVTDIKHNAKTKALEISSRIFYDDLERALEKEYQFKVDLIHPPDRKKTDAIILDYLRRHLIIRVNGKASPLHYIGYEIEEDAAWIYLEARSINRIKEISIRNDVLFKQHAEQVNILHVTVGDGRKSTKLENPENLAILKF